MKTLIATWFNPDPENEGPPHELRWGDGTRASMRDYLENVDSTFKFVHLSPICVEQHIFPDIVATVRFDKAAGKWAVSGDGVEPFELFSTNPSATDAEIRLQMFTAETVYRFRIVRD